MFPDLELGKRVSVCVNGTSHFLGKRGSGVEVQTFVVGGGKGREEGKFQGLLF